MESTATSKEIILGKTSKMSTNSLESVSRFSIVSTGVSCSDLYPITLALRMERNDDMEMCFTEPPW